MMCRSILALLRVFVPSKVRLLERAPVLRGVVHFRLVDDVARCLSGDLVERWRVVRLSLLLDAAVRRWPSLLKSLWVVHSDDVRVSKVLCAVQAQRSWM